MLVKWNKCKISVLNLKNHDFIQVWEEAGRTFTKNGSIL